MRCSITGSDGPLQCAYIIPHYARKELVQTLARDYASFYGIPPSDLNDDSFRDSHANLVSLSCGFYKEIGTGKANIDCPSDPEEAVSFLYVTHGPPSTTFLAHSSFIGLAVSSIRILIQTIGIDESLSPLRVSLRVMRLPICASTVLVT
jgi:hypothetical protein